ncbi:MAG: ribonuclease P protein component [Desulfobacterales bacterium]|uniref:Ribonuclease P protein component n=1 Tax=Candidatus Desulfatibia profunda TaxID=2841695 RepID=A0A8J6NMW7_9BACT|nr:ribonuclease P protein component [Candidatus Desulfatibia profunda]MBL7179999.1 ribonuclease P protein component [Desulfobacterales bacterium]
MRFFFARADRILKRPDFIRLSRYGKKIHNRHFVAIFCPGRFERTRLGITVSRRVGGAAARNRVKRFSREYFRLNKHTIIGCWDINIAATRAAAQLTSEQAFISLKNIFDRISRSMSY